MKNILTQSFMRFALTVVAIGTAVFTVAMIVVYLLTGQEMDTLTTMWFTVVGVELGGGIVKKSVDIITERIKKKEGLKDDEY